MNDTPPENSDSVRTIEPNTDAVLRHVLAAIEKNSHQGRTELVLAILLSLATLASTWCGYQAKAWGGKEITNRAAADTAERKAAEDTIIALQIRTFDGLELLSYWTALREKDTNTADTVLAKMRPVYARRYTRVSRRARSMTPQYRVPYKGANTSLWRNSTPRTFVKRRACSMPRRIKPRRHPATTCP